MQTPNQRDRLASRRRQLTISFDHLRLPATVCGGAVVDFWIDSCGACLVDALFQPYLSAYSYRYGRITSLPNLSIWPSHSIFQKTTRHSRRRCMRLTDAQIRFKSDSRKLGSCRLTFLTTSEYPRVRGASEQWRCSAKHDMRLAWLHPTIMFCLLYSAAPSRQSRHTVTR
jgi:hypothetical protein